MNKINLKLAFRNLLRNKLYTTINIVGLGVASAFCILVYLYVKNEHSFDRFHKDQDRLFRVELTDPAEQQSAIKKPANSMFASLLKDELQKNQLVTPTELSLDIKRNFAEVQNAIRIGNTGEMNIKADNITFKEKDNLVFADDDFFQVFSYPLVTGTPAGVLSGHNTAVISQRLAKKYFGNNNPVGKTITLSDYETKPEFTISGVFKNFPDNSSFQYDMVMPLTSDPYYQGNLETVLNSSNKLLILKLKRGTDPLKFEAKLNAFAIRLYKAAYPKAEAGEIEKHTGITLRPFADAHYNQSQGWDHYTDMKNIYQLVCLIFIILFIACLNYILLTLTNTMSRSQDVGVRKTLGANRIRIIMQYYIETQLLAFIAVIAGFLLSVVCLPFFGNLTGAAIHLADFSSATIGLFLLALSIAMGLFAGVYPALAMSGLKPLNILRSFSAYRINPVLSKCLVIAQFAICVIFIISGLVINKQMKYVNQADMGFDKDLVIRVENPYSWNEAQKTSMLTQRLYHFAQTDPAIQDMTGASFSFGRHSTNNFIINGEATMVQFLNVDYNYFTFNKIPILEGRSFSRDIAGDSAKVVIPDLEKSHKGSLARHTVVVNETLYKMLGKPQLGVINRTMGSMIIGVCRDYHTDDLTKKIEPAYHTVNYGGIQCYYIRIRQGRSIPETLKKIKENWNVLTGNLPFDYTFVDDDVAKSYNAYLRWMSTINISCILAIIIACLGLFGLSGITTFNRTKEIGIRKVLGASVSDLFLMLNRGTIVLAAGSFLIAVPVAFYLVHQWLDNFAYRITPDWVLFATAGAIAILTAIIAVSYHTIKAAMDNPVNSLRSE